MGKELGEMKGISKGNHIDMKNKFEVIIKDFNGNEKESGKNYPNYIELDLKKKYISIYGFNGAGKTTIKKLIYKCVNIDYNQSYLKNLDKQYPHKNNFQNIDKNLYEFYLFGNNSFLHDLDKILNIKRKCLLSIPVLTYVDTLDIYKGLDKKKYMYHEKMMPIFDNIIKLKIDNAFEDYTGHIRDSEEFINKDKLFVDINNLNDNNNYSFYNFLYRFLFSIELLSSIHKIPICDLINEISVFDENKYNLYKKKNKQFMKGGNTEKKYLNAIKYLNYFPLFLKKDLNQYNIPQDINNYINENKEAREIIKQKIIEYNINLENVFESKMKYFTKFFPHLKKIKLFKKYSGLFDCYFYDLKINEFKDMEEFYKNSSDGEIKLLNIFIYFLENEFSEENNYLILGDDFLTSLDNGNIHKIFEYYYSLINKNNICFINMTHEVEIYRLFNNIFNINYADKTMLKIIRGNDFSLVEWPIKKDYLNKLKMKKYNNEELSLIHAISFLPYFRSLIELLYGEDNNYYNNITNFLHVKNEKIVFLFDLFHHNFYKKTEIVNNLQKLKEKYSNCSYIDLMENLFQYTLTSKLWEPNSLEGIMFYCLYGRIKIESWILSYLPNINPSAIKSNQTSHLLNEIKKKIKKNEKEYQIILKMEELNNIIPNYMHMKNDQLNYLINIDSTYLINILNQLIELIKKGINET